MEYRNPNGTFSEGYYCMRCGKSTNMYASGHGEGLCIRNPELVAKLNEANRPEKDLTSNRVPGNNTPVATTTENSPMKTVSDLVVKVTEAFRSYGFAALNPRVTQQMSRMGGAKGTSSPSGTIRIEFDAEKPVGQVSFSQKSIDIYADIYSQDFETVMTPKALMGYQFVEKDYNEGVLACVAMRTSYTHHSGGSNGSVRDYLFYNDGRYYPR